METDQTRYVIDEREASQISTYCAIARANKSVLRLNELIQLMSIDATEEDLEVAWHHSDALSSRYLLSSGYIVDRNQTVSESVLEAETNRARAKTNLSVAKEFAEVCIDKHVELFAVSGGNSYQSAREGDDIDLFCVTTRDSLWIFMLRALIVARLYRVMRRSPQFCFSYVMDEPKVNMAFGEARDGLFARDALSAQVLWGQEYYHQLLEEADWMKRYFPRMYRYRTNVALGGEAEEERKKKAYSSKGGSRVLNSFLYYTVGSYVRMKAFLTNGRYRRKRNSPALFCVRIDRDHCIYESNKYRWLRRMYKTSVALRAEGIP